MGLFERYLSVWVGIAILAGVGLGVWVPGVFEMLAGLELAQVNLVIALCIWLMIYPMMVQVDFSSIRDVGKQPKALFLTLVVNWLIKPFTMAALGWLFFRILFADLVDPESAGQYIAGMILLGAAPCTAMVFVWSQLTRGDANYTLVQVSVNDVVLIFAYTPIVALLLGLTDITVPWDTLFYSVVLYVVVPLLAGALTRREISRRYSEAAIDTYLRRIKPWSIVGLIITVMLLFGFQAGTILANPLVIGLIAIPLLIQTYGIFVLTYGAAWWLKLPHRTAAPACMIGTSNFFEMAVAVAISVFGLHSGAALARLSAYWSRCR